MTNSERGQVAASAAEVYEEFFVPALFAQFPERVLDLAEVHPGHRVLDVGCGTGVLARAAALRVGDRGSVTGLDPNEGMLAVARRHAPIVRWEQGFAEAIPFSDGNFDRVVSQFAAMFFTDRELALAEVARVTKPGGKIAVVSWAELDQSPGYREMARLLADLFGAEVARSIEAPFALGDPAGLHRLLASVGTNPQVTRVEGTARFASIDDWVWTDVKGWTLADTIDDRQFGLLLGEARRRLSQFAGEDGQVAFDAPALAGVATIA